MSSENKKTPPISRVYLAIIFIIAGVVLRSVLSVFLQDFFVEMSITFAIILPIYLHIHFKYYPWSQFRWKPSKTRNKVQCAHHPDIEIGTHCEMCGSAVCETCQKFKGEMREYYQHNFRLNEKFFDSLLCMDCMFEKFDWAKIFLLIFGPIALGVAFGSTLLGILYESILSLIFIILGPIMMLLGIVLFVMIYFVNEEISKVALKFSKTEKMKE